MIQILNMMELLKIDQAGKKALDVIGNVEITETATTPSLNKNDGIVFTNLDGKN